MKRCLRLCERDGATYLEFKEESTNRQALHILQRILEAKMGDLTERQREALRLYYMRGMTQRQIASAWGIDKSAVSRHIARAKRRIASLVVRQND